MKEREIAREIMSMGPGEGNAGSPLSRDPDSGLDPRTSGSSSELKVDIQPIQPLKHTSNVIL